MSTSKNPKQALNSDDSGGEKHGLPPAK